eukprot:m.90976 g.90976  ORF g.90976 m.90976 type:complete len:264 (+) comp8858_c2_seq3:117-908(+)
MPICSRLFGRVAVVTGAGDGIGLAIGQRLVSEGAKVMFVDYNAHLLKKNIMHNTELEVLPEAGSLNFMCADVTKAVDIENVIAKTNELFGNIDILVNNAAQFYWGPIETTEKKDWQRLFDTNVVGYSEMIKYALPNLKQSNHAAVVNISSVSSYIAQPEQFVYNALKGAVSQLTRCLALDLAVDKIRVNEVRPGSILTPAARLHMDTFNIPFEKGVKMFGADAPMNRLGHPMEIASVAAFLASDDASFMTGASIVVDGGATLD